MSEPERSNELTYSRILSVRASQPAGEDLPALARARALDETIFDEFPPSFFPGTISNSQWDAYETRMGKSTLQNYANEAAAGVAVLTGHNTYSDPIGHSLTGKYVGAGGNGLSRVESAFYVIPTPSDAERVAKLRAGILRDLSVGFYGGEWLCTICGRDMMDWWGEDWCPHFLGVAYPGKNEGDPTQIARATIENAHLAEYSLVYDGATPGCIVAKARALAEEGRLQARERELVECRYRIQLPGARHIYSGADTRPPARENEPMEPNQPASEQPPAPPERATPPAPPVAEVREANLQAGVEWVSIPLAQVRAVGAPEGEADPGAWLLRELTRLRPLADDGRAYRSDLVSDALAEGVRAHGNEFAADTYRPILESAPLDTLKRMRDDWKRQGDLLFKGGRITQDGDGKPAGTEQDRRAAEHMPPNAAFAA